MIIMRPFSLRKFSKNERTVVGRRAVIVRLKWPKTWLLSVTVNAKLSLASKLPLRTSYVERTPGVTVLVSGEFFFKFGLFIFFIVVVD